MFLAVPFLVACAAAAPKVVAPPAPPPAARPVRSPVLSKRPIPPKPLPPREVLPPPGQLAEVTDAVPLALEAVGHGGRWLAYCAARSDTDKSGALDVKVGVGGALGGDTLSVELAIGGRLPESIDDLLGYDASGRYAVVRKGKTVSLVDVANEQRLDLGALGFDDRDDTLAYRQHRALAFDPRGEILAYVRNAAGSAAADGKLAPPNGAAPKREVVLRTLVTGAERVVTDLPGDPFRLAWDGTGEALAVTALVEDTTKNGRLDWPVRAAKGPRLTCRSPVPRFQVSAENGDRPTTFVVRRDTAGVQLAADFAASFGRAWIARAPDGSLALLDGSARRPLASADCGARILHSDAYRNLFLVACTNSKTPQKAAVELVAPGFRQELGIVIQPSLTDRSPEGATRLVPLYPGSESLLVDLERRRTFPLRLGDRVVSSSGPRALVRRGRTLVVVDVESAAEVPLAGELGKFASVVVEGGFAAVGASIVDVTHAKLVGKVAGRPLALSPSGEVLVAEGDASAERLMRGPLRWKRPLPPTP